jgi:hypothetical protein
MIPKRLFKDQKKVPLFQQRGNGQPKTISAVFITLPAYLWLSTGKK